MDNKILHVPETTSTNTLLKELLSNEKVQNGFTIYTDYQTAGRGQRGNSWESEPCNNLLFTTLLLPHSLKATDQFIISQFVSLAIKDVLSIYVNDISIKWPNDIYWKDRKIAGILIENNLIEDYIAQSFLGIGININQELFKSNAPNPISLRQITDQEYNIRDILVKIVSRILDYQKSSIQNTEYIQQEYKKALYRKDGYHYFSDGKEKFLAQILNIEDSGLLTLELTNKEIRTFAFKEVQFII